MRQNDEEKLAEVLHGKRPALVARFILAGATIGFLVGLYEATLLFFTPRLPMLLQPDVDYIIWFLAPLIGLLFFGLLGAALGLAAAGGDGTNPWRSPIGAALGLGAAGAYVVLVPEVLHEWTGDQLAARNLVMPLIWFALVFVYALFTFRVWKRRAGRFFHAEAPQLPCGLMRALLAITAVCVSGLVFYLVGRPNRLASVHATSAQPAPNPNIVLIILDTVRADHLSAYGYPRPTTPNLEQLARHGALFEDAVAPSSWTLASAASMFTGLLPHQHGANWSVPLDAGIRTLAETLESHGYETAGFNANPAYGLAGWGVARGFEVYEDESSSLRHNLASTLVGRAVVQPLYQHLVRHNGFDRRNAREINRDIFGWFGHRSSRPFFLCINYFDAHYPYLAPPPYDRRFGQLSEALMRRAVNFEYRGHVPKPHAEEQASLVAGYDNCLAFVDDQIGKLLQVLSGSRQWSNTIVIVTADHGEALGEHGAHGHGVNLYREVLHVPLIFFGPGIPAGRRITDTARIREIFPTVLGLALGSPAALRRYSLYRFWNADFKPEPFDEEAVSELISVISLTTSEWHYLHFAGGRLELYHFPTDPQEQVNLAESPQYQRTLQFLEGRLHEHLRRSPQPRRGPEYLLALTRPSLSSLGRTAAREGSQSNLIPADPWLDSSRASSSLPGRPLPGDDDLIKSLPYH